MKKFNYLAFVGTLIFVGEMAQAAQNLSCSNLAEKINVVVNYGYGPNSDITTVTTMNGTKNYISNFSTTATRTQIWLKANLIDPNTNKAVAILSVVENNLASPVTGTATLLVPSGAGQKTIGLTCIESGNASLIQPGACHSRACIIN